MTNNEIAIDEATIVTFGSQFRARAILFLLSSLKKFTFFVAPIGIIFTIFNNIHKQAL